MDNKFFVGIYIGSDFRNNEGGFEPPSPTNGILR
jgi:hypothetical protein